MIKTTRLSIPLLLLLTAHAGFADIAQSCSTAATAAIPPEDEIAAPQENCNAYHAYYGIGQTTDFVQARACAFQERKTGSHNDTPFRASAILSMIYANGDEVARNIDLALKFACEIKDGAIAEQELRVAHLLTLVQEPAEARFDLCDDITSGYMSGYCEARRADLAKQEQDHKTDALLAGATPAQQSAFDTLQRVSETYFDLNIDSTLGTSGTMRAALEIAGVEEQRTLFIDTVTRLEARETPDGMDGDFAQADQALNDIYRKLLGLVDPDNGITMEGLQGAEQAWILYRDRWLDFARLRYPDLPNDQVKTLITRQRIAAIDNALNSRY